MPTYISLHPSLNNPSVQQQSVFDEAYEETYWLPVISSASTISANQNAALTNGNLMKNNFTDSTNNVIMIAFSSGTSNPHGYITVALRDDGVDIDVITFLVSAPVGNIVLFKTEEIDAVWVTNNSGVTIGIGSFVGVGSLVKVPDHPYI